MIFLYTEYCKLKTEDKNELTVLLSETQWCEEEVQYM